jgi:carbonic anhydrase/acetyltransferase-like protein (isoleucine patch superfamily)
VGEGADAAGAPISKVHPSAFIAPSADILGDVRLGANASIWYQCVLRADMEPIIIGDRSNIQDLTMVHVDENVPCTIGNDVGVGHRAILHGCTVEDFCLIGMGAILLNHVRVGTGSVVAAGALLTEGFEVPPGSLVMGMPAKVVRKVDDALRSRIQGTVDHYVRLGALHKDGAYSMRPERGV